MSSESDTGYNTKRTAASATDSPEEVLIVVLVGGN